MKDILLTWKCEPTCMFILGTSKNGFYYFSQFF